MFSLGSFLLRSETDSLTPPDLGALFQNVANANPANRRVRFQIWPCCNLVVIGVATAIPATFAIRRGAFQKQPLPLCFSGLAVILPFLFCRIWVTPSGLAGNHLRFKQPFQITPHES